MHLCSVDGCSKPRKGFSIYCSNHHKTKARYEHPLQKPVTAQELKPYVKAVALWCEERARGDCRPTQTYLEHPSP